MDQWRRLSSRAPGTAVEAMEKAKGAACSGGATTGYLPARKGQLFDPGAYPWLETLWISDGVVLSVLSNLLVVKGERISYRALDVEQIGSVYEGIMGYAVRRIPGRCIGLKSKPQGAKKQLTTAVDLDALLELSGGKRKTWLEEEAGTTLPPKAATALKDAGSETELLEALASRIDRDLFDGPQAAGSLVFQPTEERRRSGSHYTPRALTRPIVEEALRPWLERCNHQPTAAQILDLKICDPAMGSGAFLVESCRYLAELLEQAWSREGLPEALKPDGRAHGEEPLLYARRLIAQSCLYGVDKNPFAVNLARLSLWLVSLSKDAPFTFVDHALKCGDSLVGYGVRQIQTTIQEVQLGFLNQQNQVFAQMGMDRRESFSNDSRNDEAYDRKQKQLDQQIKASEGLRTAGDLKVAAFFAGSKPKERADKQEVYLAMLSGTFGDDGLADSVQDIRTRLAAGDRGIRPFHWDLEFPEVFSDEIGGFDVFVGNPPFAGNNTLIQGYPEGILDWFKQLHAESGGQCDLVAHFFRRCFTLLRPGGSLGLIATNTIAQGDTRSSGLRWICLNGGTIYAAHKRYKWPGVAAVVVSVVHLLKGVYKGKRLLEKCSVERITAFLFAKGVDDDPKPLKANAGICFKGSQPYGQGFVFDNTTPADDDTPGIPSPIATMERLIAKDSRNASAIFPYIGGEEVNSSPTHACHRYVINFGERSEEQCLLEWPELMEIVEKKVKPGRLAQNREIRSRYWWRHGETCPAMYKSIEQNKHVLAVAQTSKYKSFAFLARRHVFDQKLVVFAFERFSFFAAMQSSTHLFWAEFMGSSMKDDPVYTTTLCCEPFPFPTALLDSAANEPAHAATRKTLEAIGERYHQFRAELMVKNNEGLTSTYNRFHDPSETSSGLLELRRLHGEMDQAVLHAYGWSDVPTVCGFGLDYLDLEDDAQLPDDLQDRIDSGELFFWEPDEACAFEAQVRAYGAVKNSRRLPWRYRWPDAVRDDVLARLLALNAERYAEEVAQGLHGKTGKKPATNSAIDGKRRGRSAKAAESTDTGQIGLAL